MNNLRSGSTLDLTSGDLERSLTIAIVKGQNNCNLKIAVQMSEWSQIIELDNLRNSETPNLATLHRLASTGSYNSIYNESLPE